MGTRRFRFNFFLLAALTLCISQFLSSSQEVAYAQSSDPVIAAAGDIACASVGSAGGSSCQQMATSDLVLWMNPTAVLTLGDNQYSDGVLADFNTYYNASWGRFKAKTYPSVGNHEYHLTDAVGYFDYFNGVGATTGRAGERAKGYYSFNLGAWHLIALNSEITMSKGSPQETWLRNDLTTATNTCVLAYFHKPRFNSGSSHGSSTSVKPLWDTLYEFKADVVLSGHEHLYERFAPQNPSGVGEPSRGIREFIVGTGGAGLYSFGTPLPNSEFRNDSTHGVLKMILNPTGYSWQFIKADANHTVLDSGTGTCIGPTGAPTTTVSPSLVPTGSCARKPQGDADCNGLINLVDFEQWRKEFLGPLTTKTSDFNNDGVVNLVDFERWRSGYFH